MNVDLWVVVSILPLWTSHVTLPSLSFRIHELDSIIPFWGFHEKA